MFPLSIHTSIHSLTHRLTRRPVDTAVNMYAHIFYADVSLCPLGTPLGVRLLCHVITMFNFLSNCQTFQMSL